MNAKHSGVIFCLGPEMAEDSENYIITPYPLSVLYLPSDQDTSDMNIV